MCLFLLTTLIPESFTKFKCAATSNLFQRLVIDIYKRRYLAETFCCGNSTPIPRMRRLYSQLILLHPFIVTVAWLPNVFYICDVNIYKLISL